MDAVEKMAISEPLNANVLALSTVANECVLLSLYPSTIYQH